jgi:hypothetical protein
MQVVNLIELFGEVISVSQVNNNGEKDFDDFLYFEMDVFDGTNDVKNGFNKFVSHGK